MAILVDWAKQTVSGTPGTGTITLSTAVSGFIRLQDDTRLTNGATVYYTIEDGSNFERGIGTYTASGTTLARTLIQAKLESGTYSETPGTGLTLTSAAIVSCSAVAATHNFRGALVYHSAAQSVSTATVTQCLWDSEIYDTSGFHSTISNTDRLTIPTGHGIRKIRLFGNIEYNAVGSLVGFRTATFYKNGAYFAGASLATVPPVASDNTIINIASPVLDCADGDYFTLRAYHTQGSTITINPSQSGGNYHSFAIEVVE